MTEERPVHIVLNGSETVATPLTDAEWADHKARETAAVTAEQTATAQREADAELVRQKAQDDPAFAALARIAGYQIIVNEGTES
jgi:hypothetical protein